MVSILRNYHSFFQSGHSILQSYQPCIRVPVLACLFFFVLSALHGIGILVPQPGIKLTPPALEAQS